jgi:tryptophan 2,3-dioxygenase
MQWVKEAPCLEVARPGHETEQSPHQCQMNGNATPILHVLSWCEDVLLKDCLHVYIKVLLQIIHCICNPVYKQNFDTLHTYYPTNYFQICESLISFSVV